MKRIGFQTFDGICDLMEERMDVLGTIRTDDAWKLCSTRFKYHTICYYFKMMMSMMVEQGKARRLGNGRWEILKPNRTPKP